MPQFEYDADAVFEELDVASEVNTLRQLFCSPELGNRSFTPAFENLIEGPSDADIKASLFGEGGLTDADALIVYVTGTKRPHWIAIESCSPRLIPIRNESDPQALRRAI